MENKAKRQRITRNLDETLTQGELLVIWRKRLGWTQSEAARHYGVSYFFYQLAEYDKKETFKAKPIRITLRPYERCFIYRRRSKKLQREIAEEMGISRYWINAQENGEVPSDKLLEYWENKK